MLPKKIGMSKWGPNAPEAADTDLDDAATGRDSQRQRGKGPIVSITVRLPRSEWERLHEFAICDGLTLQSVATTGISMLLKSRGLPPLKGP